MKKKLKLMLAVVLSLAMVMGSSLTAFSATVVMRNPNAAGVQLIGDTLLIQEDHHNFFVWGKSVMIQCPGVTDILPNNVTNMVDIQFNGNLYKGIREVLIVSTPGKDDKVRLEEGSMIITGVTTPEQVQNVKAAIVSQPNTLAALKTALTGASKDLSATKNYIVGKHNAVQNEAGSRVSKKELQGTADLVADQEVAQAVVEEAKSSASESKPAEEKKDPAPTPTPTPTPKKCTHQYSDGTRSYIICIKCGAKNPEACSGAHNWDSSNGQCKTCNYYCVHEFHKGTDGNPCIICGYNPSTPPAPTCQVDHSQYCIGWTCECGEKGTEAHFLMDDGTGRKHHCLCCDLCTADHTWEDGVCTVCTYNCDHNGQATGTCNICGKALSTTICAHTSGYDLISETQHECKYCHEKFSHEWDNGRCVKCGQPCPKCEGKGKPGGCKSCGKTITLGGCPNEANHASLHIGNKCPNCEYVGTAAHTLTYFDEDKQYHYCTVTSCGFYEEHTFDANGKCVCGYECSHDDFDKKDDATHVCYYCGAVKPHDWDQKTDTYYYCSVCEFEHRHTYNDDGVCSVCHHSCTHGGKAAGQMCNYCGITIPCSVDHSTFCQGTQCPECFEYGDGDCNWEYVDEYTHKCSYCHNTESHNWYEGHCLDCEAECPHCHGAGATGGCEICDYE